MLRFARQRLRSALGDAPTTTRPTVRLVVASAAGQGLLFLGTLVAARHVDPADFGVLGVFAVCAVLFGMPASGRLEAAIPLPVRDDRAVGILVLGGLLIPIVTTISWLAMEVLGGAVLAWTDATRLSSLPWSVPLATAIVGGRALALGWATRRGFIAAMAAGRLANGAVMGGLFAATALSDHHLSWLVAGWIAGQAAELAVLAIRLAADPACRRPRLPADRLRRLARRYRRFPTILLWSHLMEQIAVLLPTPLISAGFGAEIAGRVNLLLRIVVRPLAIIGTSMSVVLVAESARRLRERLDPSPVLAAATGRLAVLAAILFVPMAVLGPMMLAAILGPAWRDAGPFLIAMIPGVAADFVAIPVVPILGLLERLWTQTLVGGLRIALMTLAILCAAAVGCTPVSMLWILSGAMVLVGATTILLCRRGVRTARPTRPAPPRGMMTG